MSIIEKIIPEYQSECKLTRKTLERVPFEHADWKPHPKSMSMNQLASHIVDSQGWAIPACTTDEMHFDPGTWKPFVAKDSADLLKKFDENVKDAVDTMKTVSDEALFRTWRMIGPGGKVFMEMPRIAVIRGMVMNHTIHHRAQLTVYLRLKDVPVPSIYGPSADDSAGF
jgi:uncharacterized damage-inducible protein DinB